MVIQAKLTRNRNETFAAETAAHPLLVLPKRSDKASVDLQQQQQQLQLWTDSSNCSSGQFAVIANCVNTKANKTLSSSPNDHQCQSRHTRNKRVKQQTRQDRHETFTRRSSQFLDQFHCAQNTRARTLCAAGWEHGSKTIA